LNQGGTRNHRVLFRLTGTKSNRAAIGARVNVKAGKLVQFSEVRAGGSYISQNDPRLRFGLGAETKMTITLDLPPELEARFVAEASAGLTFLFRGVRISYTQVLRTPEFFQRDRWDQFGSVNVTFRY
jgi:hypothetical protein